MFGPSSDSDHEALLIHIVCVLSINVVLGDFGLQQVEIELVLDVQIGVVAIAVHTR